MFVLKLVWSKLGCRNQTKSLFSLSKVWESRKGAVTAEQIFIFFFAHVSLMAQFRNQGPFSSDKVTSEMRTLIKKTNTFSLRGNLKGRSKI